MYGSRVCYNLVVRLISFEFIKHCDLLDLFRRNHYTSPNMFDSDNIKIRFDPRYVNSTPSNDFRISNKGTYVTFTSVKNQGAVSMSLSELLCSTDDFYYEAKMTGTNNSIAVGLISYEVYVYIGARFDDEFVGGDHEVLESWREGTRQWDVIVSDTWPSNHSYTYHGDTGEVW